MVNSRIFPVSGPVDLHGQVAVVTGGAGGIGRGIASALMREGASVVIVDFAEGQQTVDELTAKYPERNAIFIKADITSEADVRGIYQTVMERFGKLEILINCAGTCTRVGLAETTREIWERDLNTCLYGTFLMCQGAIHPIMLRQEYGKIVNIASTSGKNGGTVSRKEGTTGGRSGPAYAAAKAGVINLSRWIAKEYGTHGIFCNCIAPGPVRSPMSSGHDYGIVDYPIPRMGEPEDIAEAAVFLASQASHYITGFTLNVDGGLLVD